MTNSSDSSRLPKEILSYYNRGTEADRLSTGIGPLELARTQELITRYFPPPPAVVFDVGGGPGAYSCWLARSGYEVHLIDAVPLHVEQARRASQAQPAHPIASIKVGDARKLDCPDDYADAVLLLGPLYEVVVAGDPGADETRAMVETVRGLDLHHVLLLTVPADGPDEATAGLLPGTRGKTSQGRPAAAYVCEYGSCQAPVFSAQELRVKLLG